MKAIHFLVAAAAAYGMLFFTGCGSASAEVVTAELTASETPVATAVTEAEAGHINMWDTDENGCIRYYDGDGNSVTGTQHIGNHVYLFSPDGVLATGWQTVEGKRFYYDPQTGRQQTGWIPYQDEWYYVTLTEGKLTGKISPIDSIDGDTCKPGDFMLTDEYGALLTGQFQYADGNFYYADESGLIRTGDVQLGDGWYRFGSDGVQQTGWQTISGNRYYFYAESGQKAIGLTELNGSLYDFGTDGSMQTGWQTVSGNRYYFYAESGQNAVGLTELDGILYYFGTNGSMQTGWQTISGKQYYFAPKTGAACTGWLTLSDGTYFLNPETMTAVTGQWNIDKVPYYFDAQHRLLKNASIVLDGVTYCADAKGVLTEVVVQDENGMLIAGTAQATAAQMTAYIKSVNPNVAQSVLDMIPYYLSEGKKEGIRGDIAFAQSCLETGNFAFKGSAVTLSQNNFCGLGVTSNGMKGNSFATPQLGIRAQIQHLKAYANMEALVQAQIDPRFGYVQRGCAPYVEWLGIQENPSGRGWAAGAGYGEAILRILNGILSMPA